MKMRAIKDFLHPYDSVIYTVGTEFDLSDEPLCEYLVGMGTLEYADEPEVDPPPSSKKKSAEPAKAAPTKAELSSGTSHG